MLHWRTAPRCGKSFSRTFAHKITAVVQHDSTSSPRIFTALCVKKADEPAPPILQSSSRSQCQTSFCCFFPSGFIATMNLVDWFKAQYEHLQSMPNQFSTSSRNCYTTNPRCLFLRPKLHCKPQPEEAKQLTSVAESSRISMENTVLWRHSAVSFLPDGLNPLNPPYTGSSPGASPPSQLFTSLSVAGQSCPITEAVPIQVQCPLLMWFLVWAASVKKYIYTIYNKKWEVNTVFQPD